MQASKRVIVTGVNDNPHYMDCMKALLASIKKNAPAEKVCVLLVNCNKDYEAELYRINANIETKKIIIPNCGAISRITRKREYLLSKLSEYAVVAWIDNDAIVRKPLDGLFAGMTDNTLKIWRKNMRKNSHKFQAGVYVVGNGEPIKKWITDIMTAERKHLNKKGAELDGHGSPHWFVSQELLYTCFLNNDGITRLQLSTRFNDCTFDKNSVIWHCKSSHFNEKKYQKEYKRYLC